jgi:hypothetical protein
LTARWPDFFIVGAPRCGTTSMHTALRQHPDIYLPERKEPAYFCSDLDLGEGFGAVDVIRDEGTYLALFEGGRADQLIGEACALNLFSSVAAGRIKNANPDARIVIHLRDPIEQIASWHSVLALLDVEPFSDLRKALAAEHSRRPTADPSPEQRILPITRYRAVATFGEQVQRYLDIFPRGQVHFVVFDDFKADPEGEVSGVLTFLGVSADFQPHLTVDLPNRGAASMRLFDAMRSRRLLAVAKRVVPSVLHARANRAALAVHRWNIRWQPRRPLDTELRDQLRSELAADVRLLSELLQRDLADLWWGPSAAR